ncbi:Uncharacterised protein [Mycobacterium tuberculosis]|uniref:Uncharacterized protein n=1 Tax=Mycobacterium tuberculosis TaxID=1773 RepID=A0A0U0SFB6_MYCTX|nr:Uncharacterised protein [Mycobacterium tuberculosis]CFE38945.1 Uncharacterised protein [Mycobacterium tuberculosis]CFE66711.1 Uncharacterised protein [Mycobacterium tuberculosis]CFG94655.1 Uncharacterised protein [Mycobacterium tuberculosis]CKO36425.1 Uncharacterised protein [Mycobacterium tuberculosis]
MRMLSTNHPQQPPHPTLLKIGSVTRQHRLSIVGQHIQPRLLGRDLWNLAGDTHHMFDKLAAAHGGFRVGVAGLRRGQHEYAGEPAGAELVAQPRGLGCVVGALRPGHRCALRVVHLQRVGQLCGHQIRSVTRADQQPGAGFGVAVFGQLTFVPFDAQQPLTQNPGTFAGLRRAGTQLQPTHRQHHRAVLVQHVQVGFHAHTARGHRRAAVPGMTGRPIGPQPPHTQRQQQTTVGHTLDGGMSRHRLEARIQQHGMHAVSFDLRAKRAR